MAKPTMSNDGRWRIGFRVTHRLDADEVVEQLALAAYMGHCDPSLRKIGRELAEHAIRLMIEDHRRIIPADLAIPPDKQQWAVNQAVRLWPELFGEAS